VIIGEHTHLTFDGLHWVAVVDDGLNTFCEAAGVLADVVVVDKIATAPEFRRKGYATRLVRALERHFGKPVRPSEVLPTVEAMCFWESILNERGEVA